MKKEIFFVHSAGTQDGDEGSSGLVKYLAKQLNGQPVFRHPLMPGPDNPRYTRWRDELKKQLPGKGTEVTLIGHSLGGSVILKYLSEEVVQMSVNGLFLVGVPWWGTRGWMIDEFQFRTGFESKLPDLGKIFIYHSREDQWVPFSHRNYYKKSFPSATVRELEGSDHEFKDGLPALIKDIHDLSI